MKPLRVAFDSYKAPQNTVAWKYTQRDKQRRFKEKVMARKRKLGGLVFEYMSFRIAQEISV